MIKLNSYECHQFGRPFDNTWIKANTNREAKLEASKRLKCPVEQIICRKELEPLGVKVTF